MEVLLKNRNAKSKTPTNNTFIPSKEKEKGSIVLYDNTTTIPNNATVEENLLIQNPIADPYENPGFLNAQAQVGSRADDSQNHETPEQMLTQTEDAAHTSAEEQRFANNQIAHTETIEEISQVEREPITADIFIRKFKEKLDELEREIPDNETEAEEFIEENPIGALNNDIQEDINEEQQNRIGDLQNQSATKTPPTSDLPIQEPISLPPVEQVRENAPVNINQALPQTRTDEQISLEDDAQAIDNQLAENNISTETLENSNEPDFIAAANQQREAHQIASDFPALYRTAESLQINAIQSQMASMSSEGLQNMTEHRAQALENVATEQSDTSQDTISKQQEINTKLQEKYDAVKESVSTLLEELNKRVTEKFDNAITKANDTFKKNVEDKLGSVYGTLGWRRIYKSEERINREVAQVYKDEKAIFLQKLNTAIEEIANDVANTLNNALNFIKNGKKEIQDYFDGLSDEEKRLGQEAFDGFQDQFNDLENSVYEQQDSIIDGLAEAYHASVLQLDETFQQLNEEAGKTLLDYAVGFVSGIVDTILELKRIINDLLSAIREVIDVIMNDPIGFVANLFAGIKKGFDNFVTNIETHLITGLVEWLTGTLGPMGITMPENLFSLKGIFELVMQILGLGWHFIRAKAVKLLGEPAVKFLETSFELFTLFINEGISGIWEYLKEKFNDLKETVIEEIKSLLIVQVVEAGIKWLISLLVPGAGFIKAIMAIKDFVVFFVESAIALIPTITDAILGLARGSVAFVANAIEIGLSKIIPLLIKLLANLLGIGGLAKKVTKIIGKIRKRIDRQVDKIIQKAKKKLKSLFGKKKKKSNNNSERLEDTEVGKEVAFRGGNENHKIYFQQTGNRPQLMMASNPAPLKNTIIKWKEIAATKDEQTKTTLLQLIGRVESEEAQLDSKALETKNLMQESRQHPEKAANAHNKDNEIEQKEDTLTKTIKQILELIGHDVNPLINLIGEKVADINNGVITSIDQTFKTTIDSSDAYNLHSDHTIHRKSASDYVKVYIDFTDGTLKEGEGDNRGHNKFKPEHLQLAESNNGYHLKFDTDSFTGNRQNFEVIITYDDVEKETNDKTYSQDVHLTGGHFAPGKRAVNDSAGKGFENAHIIGDQFGGSGLNESLNIKPSSVFYNQQTMKNVEKNLADAIKNSSTHTNSNFQFNAVARLVDKYDERFNENDFEKLLKDAINKLNTNNDNKKKMEENSEQLKRILRTALKFDMEKAPHKFLGLSYAIDMKITENADHFDNLLVHDNENNNVNSEKGITAKIGEDTQYEEALNELFKSK